MKVFITGGTSGLGLTLAEAYLKRGYKVGVCARHKKEIPTISMWVADVSEYDDLEKAFIQFAPEGVDIFINCAGSYSGDEKEMQSTNVLGTENALKLYQKFSIKQFVQIGTIAALLPYHPKMSAYTRSKKEAIELLNKSQIPYCLIMPGYIDTPRLKQYFPRPHFLVPQKEACQQIIRGIERQAKIICFPKLLLFLITLKLLYLKVCIFYKNLSCGASLL